MGRRPKNDGRGVCQAELGRHKKRAESENSFSARFFALNHPAY